jgi:hypothetical protein
MEILEEAVVSSRGKSRPRAVKRRSCPYPTLSTAEKPHSVHPPLQRVVTLK